MKEPFTDCKPQSEWRVTSKHGHQAFFHIPLPLDRHETSPLCIEPVTCTMGHKARKKSFKANKASRTPKRPIQAPAAEEGEDSSGDGKSKKDSTSNLSKIQREWLVLHRERLQLVKELAATKKLKPTSNPSHPDYDKLQVILKRLETNPQLLVRVSTHCSVSSLTEL